MIKVSLFCGSSSNACYLWQKRLGHPNAKDLLSLLDFGFLLNKSYFTMNDITFDFSSCKMGKSKSLPFPSCKVKKGAVG